ncbi:hypothetical protein ACGGZK_03130 [Agromyces sp. MMS24-K17]|uniref:hypothetical protein n=1 Tax=Agromyces sp. MMS24-K17 TaxID=3372850 RepID=UPI0037540FEE
MPEQLITIAAWNPAPLIAPAVLGILAIAMSIAGTRLRLKPLREAGYVAFIVAGFAVAAMWWSLSGMWDTSQRERALEALGYESPTFQASAAIAGEDLPPWGFHAVRDGARVRGVLHHVEGEQWRLTEVEVEQEEAED